MSAMQSVDDDVQLIYLLGEPAYDNSGEPTPWSNKPEILRSVTITFLVLSWMFVLFRLYVRLRVVRSAGWDDLFVALYLIFGSIGSLAFIISIEYGAGQHMLRLAVGQMKKYLVCFYITNATLNVAATFIKLSLLFQYLRIFRKGTYTYLFTIMLITAVACWGFVFSILAFVPCETGPRLLFTPESTVCWAYGSDDNDIFANTFKAHTVFNMIFDLIISLIPLRLCRAKEMTFKSRLGLLALLCMGALVNFLSLWRMLSIVEHKAGSFPTKDETWYGPISILLGVLEINVASVCASVPIFWPILTPYLSAIFVTHEVDVQVAEYRDVEEGKGHQRTGSEGLPPGSVTLPPATHQHGRSGSEASSVEAARADQWSWDTHPDNNGDEMMAANRDGVHCHVRSESGHRRKNSMRKWV